MLILIALSATLLQDPPAPPPPQPPLEVRGRLIFMGMAPGEGGPGEIDADGDGGVTRDEFAAPVNDAFTRMDRDGDGRLSSDELATNSGPMDGETTLRRRRGGGGGPRLELRRSDLDGPRGSRPEREGERAMVFVAPGGDGPAPHLVVRTYGGANRIELGEPHPADLDTDGDGRISEAEFLAPLREAFARHDADQSGFIEAGERGREDAVHIRTHPSGDSRGE